MIRTSCLAVAVTFAGFSPTAKQNEQTMKNKILLTCGILSSLLYIAMNIIVPLHYPGYSSTSQTVSELSAIGAPTRMLWSIPGAFYTLLVLAFGYGVWKAGSRNRRVRITGALILAYGALGFLWPFASMHRREVLAAGGGTFSDTLHLVLGGVTVLLMTLAMVVGAGAFGKKFRVYTLLTILVLLLFGGLTAAGAPGVGKNLPTPRIGVWERINIGVFLLWIVVLAIALWRKERRNQ